MRRGPTVAIVLGTLFGAAQFIRPTATNPPVQSDLVAPTEVKNVLRRACYDCHSNETAWPWYSAVAPASWLLRHDVNEGRRRLNFSDWAAYASDPETAAQKLRQIATSVANGDMSPHYYRLLHADAHLTAAQREILIRWAEREATAQRAPD